jgi:hypothetical protein
MPGDYAYYQFRLEVLSPVAADSPFDSDTLWGRIVCALMEGSPAERSLAQGWLARLREGAANLDHPFQPPLIVSEGFQCDRENRPWLPVPFVVRLRWEAEVGEGRTLPRKAVKELECVPEKTFFDLCEGKETDLKRLRVECADAPRTIPLLQPHLAMNRLSGIGLDRMLYMMPLAVYRAARETPDSSQLLRDPERRLEPPPRICFFLKILRDVDVALIDSALKRLCDEGWGHAKSRGIGCVRSTPLEAWDPTKFEGTPNGFVSLSHFCPAADNPAKGYWKIQAKHPVPAQFVDDKRVVLGAGSNWRVKSFLRLTAGSCFQLEGRPLRENYGRFLGDLLRPPVDDAEKNKLPSLFHYALSFSWPLNAPWPKYEGEWEDSTRQGG